MEEVCTPFPLSEAELRARLSPETTTATRDVLDGRVVVEQVERDALQTALKRRRIEEKEVRTFECLNVITLPSRRCFVKKSKREKGEYEMRALAAVTNVAFVHNLPTRTPLLLDAEISAQRTIMFLDDVGRSVEQCFFKASQASVLGGTRGEEGTFDRCFFVDAVCAQVVLTLYTLQRRMGFCHNDLHTKNVSVRECETAFALEDECGSFLFPSGSPYVCFTDLEFAMGSGLCASESAPRQVGFVQNATNNSFDVVRFFTALFHPERSRAEREALSRLSPSLRRLGEEMVRYVGTRHETEHFPHHVSAPTPSKILSAHLEFIERFRVSRVPPLVRCHRTEPPSAESRVWFAAREARSNGVGAGPKRVNWFPFIASNREEAREVVRAIAEGIATEVSERMWQLCKNGKASSRSSRAGSKSGLKEDVRTPWMAYEEGSARREVRAHVVRAQRICRLAYVAMEHNPEEMRKASLGVRCRRAIDETCLDDVWSLEHVCSGVCAESWSLDKFCPSTGLDAIRQCANRSLY